MTNRKLVRGDFLERLKEIARQRPAGILLREKDLTPEEYRKLAREVQSICKKAGVPCILHSFTGVAEELEADALHLPLPLLRKLPGPCICLCRCCESCPERTEGGSGSWEHPVILSQMPGRRSPWAALTSRQGISLTQTASGDCPAGGLISCGKYAGPSRSRCTPSEASSRSGWRRFSRPERPVPA